MSEQSEKYAMISARKQCNPTCQLFAICPKMKEAQAYVPDEGKGEGPNYRPCLLKYMGPADQTRMINMCLSGEEGMLNEIRSTLYDMGLQAELKGKYDKYLDFLLRFYKLVYVDQKKAQDLDNAIEVTVSETRGRYAVGRPEDDEPLEPTEEDDPESLMFSPIIDEISSKN